LLAGCPPCQGFSTMRTLKRRTSVRDRRNELIFEFLRFVRVLRPKTVMLENVPGFAEDRRIERFRSSLKSLGYSLRTRVVNAAHYGVPQRRNRFLLLASRQSTPSIPNFRRKAPTVRD